MTRYDSLLEKSLYC